MGSSLGLLAQVNRLRALQRAPRAVSPTELADLGLLGFVPRLSPTFASPEHLAPVAAIYERIAAGEAVKAVVVCPPRHGKTELELHALAWMLARDPSLEFCFAGYSATFARSKSRRARSLSIRAGVPIDPAARSVTDWRTGVENGGLWATSVCGPVTGNGFHIVLLDDPVKGRIEAESGVKREATMEWFRGDVINRLHPGGSCVVTQTRWHPQDPAGQLIDAGWELVRLPAIDDEGHALWPERYDEAALATLRKDVGEYNWASLYQGEPRPRGGTLFGDVATYDALPATYRIIVGLDLAYTAKTHADYSVAVVCAEADGMLYVLDVVRRQLAAPDFAALVRKVKNDWPHARLASYIGGTEKGVVDLLNREPHRLGIETMPARADKFVRAQAAAAGWNAAKIALPHAAPWLDAFVAEVCGFTGVSDPHDDQVDALVSAFDAVRTRVANPSDFDKYRKLLPRTRI